MKAYISTQFAPAGCFTIHFYTTYDQGYQFQVFMMINERLRCNVLFNRLKITVVEFSPDLPDDVLNMVIFLNKFNSKVYED